jgi:hypothetical protein
MKKTEDTKNKNNKSHIGNRKGVAAVAAVRQLQ